MSTGLVLLIWHAVTALGLLLWRDSHLLVSIHGEWDGTVWRVALFGVIIHSLIFWRNHSLVKACLTASLEFFALRSLTLWVSSAASSFTECSSIHCVTFWAILGQDMSLVEGESPFGLT